MREFFNTALTADKIASDNINLFQKREFLKKTGSNLTLKDKRLSIERLHPYMLIENELKEQRKLFSALEPGKKGYTERRKAAFAASLPTWLRG